MKRTRGDNRLTGALLVLLSIVSAQAVFGQQTVTSTERGRGKALVVLTRLSSPRGDIVAETLASTITNSVDVDLRLSGAVKLERADFLSPTVAFDRSLGYYKQVGADGAVYGSVHPGSKGGYSVVLGVWNTAGSFAKTSTIRRTISNLLSSFGLADEIALEAASTIVGRKLSEGTLVVKDITSLGRYAVYADGQLLGRNRTVFHVITGSREIIIARPGKLGDIPLQTFHVDIKQNGTTKVTFSPAPASQNKTSHLLGVKVAKTGLLMVDVNAIPHIHGTVRVQVTEAGKPPGSTVTRTGNADAPFYFVVVPGKYDVNAGFENDVTFPAIGGQAKVVSGSVATVKLNLNYSSTYQVQQRISTLQAKRDSWHLRLRAIQRQRSVKAGWGVSLEIAGLLSGLGAAVFSDLARIDYANYEAATTAAGATQYRTASTIDRVGFYGTSISGLASIVVGAVFLFKQPSTNTVEQSIRELDSQLAALESGVKGGK